MKSTATLKIPDEIRFGDGAAAEVGKLARQFGQHIFLISDHGLENAGLVGSVRKWLQQEGLHSEEYLDVEPEPSIESVKPCLEKARRARRDVVIGLGGGSVLDVAKAVAMMLTNEGQLREYLGAERVLRRGVPSILLPTTAGTGAEVTPNALFYIPEERAKRAIVSKHIIPTIALIDPELTMTAPPGLTAATGLDALCHAIESFTGLNATPLTEPFAREAIKQIASHLRHAVSNGNDPEARNGMALGSLYAAISLANSGTNAVHALAYPLQGLNRIEHGIANALLLPYVMRFNSLGDTSKFAEVALLMGVSTSQLYPDEAAKAAAIACKELSEDVGIPQHMSDVGIQEGQLEELVEGALSVQRLLKNNPRAITREDIRSIYMEAM